MDNNGGIKMYEWIQITANTIGTLLLCLGLWWVYIEYKLMRGYNKLVLARVERIEKMLERK